MDDLSFLDEDLSSEYGAYDAILKAVLPGGKVIHIADTVCPVKFLDSCPLLYHAFEYNAQSRLQAGIEATSETAIISLVRYCYTGTYLAEEPDGESVRLLQHAETYKIAEDFDVPELQIMAHGNFSCQIEYACCLTKPPEDLLDTIRFIYCYFASDEARRKHNLVDTLLNYCVAVYLIHQLGESLDFLTAIHELPAFRQDLCRTNIVRNFEDDCAADIIRLPASPPASSSKAPTTLASRDLPSAMLYNVDVSANSNNNDLTLHEPIAPTSHLNIPLAHPIIQRGFPDHSQHSVSPAALAAALAKCRYRSPYPLPTSPFSNDTEPETDTSEALDLPLRAYKRARFSDTTSLLNRNPLSEGPTSSASTKGKEVKLECDEEAFWAGAFGHNPDNTQATGDLKPPISTPTRVQQDNKPLSASTSTITASPTASVQTSLPHRPHLPSVLLPPSHTVSPQPSTLLTGDLGFETDGTTDDESFTLIHTPTASAPSLASSPEVVPANVSSVTETMSRFRNGAQSAGESDDEWTVL